MTNIRKNKAFTMAEMLVVVIIISVIAAFAIPNFRKSIDKATEHTAETNLLLIREGMEAYILRNGEYPYPNQLGVNLPMINQALDLSILGESDEYQCYSGARGGGPVEYEYQCRFLSSTTDSAAWKLTTSRELDINYKILNDDPPRCLGTGCPTCDGNGCPHS